MAGKREQIVKYIESLDIGNRISVRGLAETMSVSEGTAYRAIKSAEDMGLVKTKAKAGTIRIGQSALVQDETLISNLIKRLGLSVLAGERFTNATIDSVVLGDCSSERFQNKLDAATGSVLCIVGDRPDILLLAAGAGVNILVSDGTPVSKEILNIATNNRACVLSSLRDSYSLMSLAYKLLGNNEAHDSGDVAQNWMGMPMFLYNDDIVADWHRVYGEIIQASSKCAVVDSEQRICGAVDAVSAISSPLSMKISTLLAAGETCLVADKNTTLQRIAEQMIASGSHAAYISDDGKLSGVLTSGDVLRYFLYNSSTADQVRNIPSSLEIIDRRSSGLLNMYLLRNPVGIQDSSVNETERMYQALYLAAHMHCEELFGTKCDFESGTFYSLNTASASEELMVSSQVIKSADNSCTIQVEVFDDTACYARMSIIAFAAKLDKVKHEKKEVYADVSLDR